MTHYEEYAFLINYFWNHNNNWVGITLRESHYSGIGYHHLLEYCNKYPDVSYLPFLH